MRYSYPQGTPGNSGRGGEGRPSQLSSPIRAPSNDALLSCCKEEFHAGCKLAKGRLQQAHPGKGLSFRRLAGHLAVALFVPDPSNSPKDPFCAVRLALQAAGPAHFARGCAL